MISNVLKCFMCHENVYVNDYPAENKKLLHLDCRNPECSVGPIYGVNVGEAKSGSTDVSEITRAMKELAAHIENDAEVIQEIMDSLGGMK